MKNFCTSTILLCLSAILFSQISSASGKLNIDMSKYSGDKKSWTVELKDVDGTKHEKRYLQFLSEDNEWEQLDFNEKTPLPFIEHEEYHTQLKYFSRDHNAHLTANKIILDSNKNQVTVECLVVGNDGYTDTIKCISGPEGKVETLLTNKAIGGDIDYTLTIKAI